MQLVYYPDPILLTECTQVDSSQKESLKTRRIFRSEMYRVMNKHGGCGLAAPQVGLNRRIFVWKENGFDQIIWNPVLKCISGKIESIEGCLSLPGVAVKMIRNTSCIMTGIGINNLPIQFIGNASNTKIWQHEIDHLDGKLILDWMSREETSSNKGTLRRLLKNFEA
jgi:peptide deformylase